MRILHHAARYPPAIGGAERFCAGLARWQAAQGHDVQVLTLRALGEEELWGGVAHAPRATALGPSDRDGRVQVRRLAPRPLGSSLLHLLGHLELRSVTCALGPDLVALALRAARRSDVVHAHGVPGTPAFLAWLAARAARRPFVVTPYFHTGENVYQERPVLGLLRRADAVVAVTAAERDALVARGVAAERIACTSAALDAETGTADAEAPHAVRAALGLAPDTPLVCVLGRKAASKGLDVLLGALPHLRHRPAPTVVLAGPSTAWADALPRPAGLRVVDLPPLSERQKTALLAAADLLVLPSRNESFGIVFLEAWAAGTPVVGAAIPAVEEVLDDPAATFRPDDVRDLAHTVDRMLADPAHGRRQVASGRARIASAHGWDRVGRDVEAAYRRLLR